MSTSISPYSSRVDLLIQTHQFLKVQETCDKLKSGLSKILREDVNNLCCLATIKANGNTYEATLTFKKKVNQNSLPTYVTKYKKFVRIKSFRSNGNKFSYKKSKNKLGDTIWKRGGLQQKQNMIMTTIINKIESIFKSRILNVFTRVSREKEFFILLNLKNVLVHLKFERTNT